MAVVGVVLGVVGGGGGRRARLLVWCEISDSGGDD